MLDIYFLENTNRSFNDLYLCYCGLEKCVPLYSFGPAVRPNYLIHYVLDGEGYYYVNDNKYKVRKNQGFLIEPNVVTFYQADKDNPWTYLWIGIDGDKAKLYLNSVGLDSEHLIFTHEKDDALKEYVLEMLKHHTMSDSDAFKIEGLLYLFFSKLCENHKETSSLTREENTNNYINKAIEFIQNNYQGLTSLTFKSGLAVTGQGIISYVIANITVYFILVDKRIFIKFLNFILPYDVIETIIIKKNNLGEVIKIEIKLVIICMIITIVGFKILNVPSAIFLGVICGILDILPYVGTIIVFIPIIIYNIIMKKYLLVVGLIALYLLLQIIREVLELKFLSSKLDIHPLVVMLSMYIGAEIFGIIGILIGPIYCLIAKDLIYEGTL